MGLAGVVPRVGTRHASRPAELPGRAPPLPPSSAGTRPRTESVPMHSHFLRSTALNALGTGLLICAVCHCVSQAHAPRPSFPEFAAADELESPPDPPRRPFLGRPTELGPPPAISRPCPPGRSCPSSPYFGFGR